MIGKDMTKMTLPVSFNEPTSLLQRVAEDMEYSDLLDFAADRADSMERMVYVAAFAASEYASTIGRVAKPFNPLLGETFEYVRPDKGYRFFVEQVSHHPPIGAAHAESANWDYYVCIFAVLFFLRILVLI
jgi:oxysterol-binding protein 1